MSNPNVSVTVQQDNSNDYTIYEGTLEEVSQEIAENEESGYTISEVVELED